MSFIQKVKERTAHANDLAHFKNLQSAYQLVGGVGVTCPKVYWKLSLADSRQMKWRDIHPRLPNIFVMRPSHFLNPRNEFFIRDDGPRGLMNFTTLNRQKPAEALNLQVQYMGGLAGEPCVLFEEFPITPSNVVEYPPHYRAHVFHNRIGCIQVVAPDRQGWFTPQGEVLASVNEQDINDLLPAPKPLQDLCAASRAVSVMTKQPYMRVDMIVSTRAAIFRSLACLPGDVRSDQHNWFYRKYDQEYNELWEQAVKDIANTTQKGKVADDDAAPAGTTVPALPDDNA